MTTPAGHSAAQASRDTLVLTEQLRAVYGAMKPAAIAGTIGPVLIAATVANVIPMWRLVLWWCLVAATLGVGSVLLRRYFLVHNALPQDADRWLRMAAVRSLLASTAYGSAGVLLFSPDSQSAQIILFAWLVAISTLVTVETANHRWLYRCTLFPMLVPFIVRATIHADTTALILAASAAILLTYLLIGARKLNQLISESLHSRFANAELVEQLRIQIGITEGALAGAKEANRAKSRFLAAASHDLRQPIHALGLFVSAVGAHVPDAEGQRIVQRMTFAVDSTEILFNAMLDVSRLDAGVLVPDTKPFLLAPMLERLAAEYALRAEAKGLRLRVRSGEYTVLTDPALLERVIRNYLGNAVRYTDKGSLLLGARWRGNALDIQLWDTGQGIPADKLDDIYKEFYQLGNPERDRSKGLGLGLAIVKRIAHLLGHPTKVASQVGRGSMFSIEVPLAPAAMTQDGTDVAITPIDEGVLVGACVVVIDDEADARDAIQVLLKQWGCFVLTADSGDHALELIRRHEGSVDVILSDYRLREGRTGIEAIQAIEREVGDTPAALVTGDTAPDRLKDAAESGYELLHKPLNPLRLKQTLCRLLAQPGRLDLVHQL